MKKSNSPTGKLSMEQLMAPRWIVFADYPGNQRKVNDIIYGLGNEFDDTELERQLSLFPHIFRKLVWHELRSVEEMPDFLKYKTGHVNPEHLVYPVSFSKGEFGWDIIVEGMEIKSGNYYIYLFDKLPATQTDFEQYLQTKTKEK